MQEDMIKAYMKRRGFVGTCQYQPDLLGFPGHGRHHYFYEEYRKWVFAWIDQLTAALPPR